MFRDEHMNPYTILHRAQLLERFGSLQWRRFPLHKLQQHRAAEAVNALMAQKQGAVIPLRAVVSPEPEAKSPFWMVGGLETAAPCRRDRRPRKIKGATGAIDHNFHLM